MRDFLEGLFAGLIFIFGIILLIVLAVVGMSTVSCNMLEEVYKTPTTYVPFNECFIMNADGDYIPESAYKTLLTYGE
jgi:hypothetical protein